jgi:hypothetical protein
MEGCKITYPGLMDIEYKFVHCSIAPQ